MFVLENVRHILRISLHILENVNYVYIYYIYMSLKNIYEEHIKSIVYTSSFKTKSGHVSIHSLYGSQQLLIIFVNWKNEQ